MAQTIENALFDMAAQMSFYFVLSLFPFFMIVAGLVGYLPSTMLWQNFAQWITDYLPPQSRRVVFETILGLSRGSTGFLSFGLIATFWTASSGFVSLMESLSRTFGVRDTRSFWLKRGIAVCATIVAALFLMGSFGLLALGHWIAVAFADRVGSVRELRFEWSIVRWLATLAFLCVGIELADYFLPNVPRRRWHWLSPGTLFAALTLLVASPAFSVYVRHFSNIPKIYGALAGFIILLVWIYLANLVLLLGAQIDRVVQEMAGRGALA